jgi:glucose/arabinose dehydrogenase
MTRRPHWPLLWCVTLSLAGAVTAAAVAAAAPGDPGRPPEQTIGPEPTLPAPFHSPSVRKESRVIGWPDGKTPAAPAGFKVTRFAGVLDNPRWPYVLPDGQGVLIAESNTIKRKASANRITLLRDADGDGVAEQRHVFAENLNQPFGMLVLGDHFYVANTDGVLRFPFRKGQTKLEGKGERVLDLPADGYNNHWTRNVIASPDGRKLYMTVGSATNVDEKLDQDARDERRAAILECNPDGSGARVFAGGIRNPNGLAWEPVSGALWTACNERDLLGDDLVPDYITSVKEGGFYGWPYAYFGPNEDPTHKGKRPDLVARTIKPDYALGSHTASIGLICYGGKAFPAKYHGGMFVAQRGSWNRSTFTGYRVLFVPFRDGRPSGAAEDFLTGFIADESKLEVYGRPTGLAEQSDGSLLVTDDAANTVWHIRATKDGR